MSRRVWLWITLCLITGSVCLGRKIEALPSRPTKVLVVGTIHQALARDRNYTYVDIVRILATYDPDLICVEIRPKDFRRKPYLKEMELATVWGLSHGKRVAPIDWWNGTAAKNDREIRAKLAKEPEYVAKQERVEELLAGDEVITRFEKRYGSMDDIDKWGAQLGYRFWNGKNYNDAIAEGYKLSMEVYGDSPFNLHYLTRNNHMMDLILKAIQDNSSRRVIVLTGAEHKHFFDREFRKDATFETADFDSILPLRKVKLGPAVARFLNDDDDLSYFEKGYPGDLDAYYHYKLIPLIHGPNMDVHPSIIPAANIKLAGKILIRWKSAVTSSDRETFDSAWYRFLNEDYSGAIVLLRGLAERVDNGKVTDPFVREETYLNLGRSYDMLGKRTKALDCYHRVEQLLVGTRFERAKAYILQNYETVPYQRSKTK